jgi:hypothetical protein
MLRLEATTLSFLISLLLSWLSFGDRSQLPVSWGAQERSQLRGATTLSSTPYPQTYSLNESSTDHLSFHPPSLKALVLSSRCMHFINYTQRSRVSSPFTQQSRRYRNHQKAYSHDDYITIGSSWRGEPCRTCNHLHPLPELMRELHLKIWKVRMNKLLIIKIFDDTHE